MGSAGPARPEATRALASWALGRELRLCPCLFKRESAERLLCAEQHTRLQGGGRSGEEGDFAFVGVGAAGRDKLLLQVDVQGRQTGSVTASHGHPGVGDTPDGASELRSDADPSLPCQG